MEIVYVVAALAVLAAAYFLFFRKSGGTPEIAPTVPEQKLPEKKAEAREEKRDAKKASAPPPPPKSEARAESTRPVPEASVQPEEPTSEPVRRSLTSTRNLEGMRKGLAKSRGSEGFFGKLKALLAGSREIDPNIAEQIEEVLLASDVGVASTEAILARIKESLSRGDLADSGKVWDALREEARRILDVGGAHGAFDLRARPTVVLMVGVNGAGKTTTIGKLATKLQNDGKKVVLAAGDTFRAAAVKQLVVWGERVGAEVVHGKDGADPGSVVFDAIKKAEAAGADIVLADTAGRLHTKTNLMSEMTKIAKTAEKALAGAPHEILLVIDATNGQNALAQAKEFKESLPLTGIVLTKLDGTAKGGVVLGICDSLKIPVRFIGLGERPDDLHDFSPDDFVEALLGKETEATAA
jgi:fused signal recognition particle receptor